MVVVTENHRDVNCVPGLQVIGYSQPTWLLGGGQDARATWPGHPARSIESKVTSFSTPIAARIQVLKT
jgi:hypothetical protein